MLDRDELALKLLATTDARIWAQEFCSQFPDCGVDEYTLVAWFANAIETGRSASMGGPDPRMEIYDFDECPEPWQELSTNGGDEDWIVAYNSGDYDEYWPETIATGLDSMKQPQRVMLPDGRTAWICSHA